MMAWVSRLSVWPAVVPAFFLAYVLSLLGSGLIWSLVLLPFAILMGALLYRAAVFLNARWGMFSAILATVGLYSFGIFLVHMLVISAVVNRIQAFGIGAGSPLFYVLLLPGTVLGSVVTIYLINRLPFGHYLSGIKRAANKDGRKRGQLISDRTLGRHS